MGYLQVGMKWKWGDVGEKEKIIEEGLGKINQQNVEHKKR